MIVLCDFDDTATVQNVAQLLMHRFLPGRWQEFREQFRRKEITLKEYQERPFSLMREDRETLKAYAREHGTLREGFVELARYCQDHGIELAIVTVGLDFYVEGVLEKYGLEGLPYYAVECNFTGDGMGFTYRYARPGSEMWGNCKCRILEEYRAQGHEIIYAGDGISDMCAASRADLVFALGRLLPYCQERGIPHRELGTFHDIIAELERRREVART